MKRFAVVTGCLLAAVAVAQTSVWYRVRSTNQSPQIVEFTPEGFVTWSNEVPDGHGVLERASWADGFWSRAFTVSNQYASATVVRVRCDMTNAPGAVEVCTHNLHLIARAKDAYFLEHGTPPMSYFDLLSSGLPSDSFCPAGGFYSIGSLHTDPNCTFGQAGHTL